MNNKLFFCHSPSVGHPRPCAADYFGDYQLIQCITVQVKEKTHPLFSKININIFQHLICLICHHLVEMFFTWSLLHTCTLRPILGNYSCCTERALRNPWVAVHRCYSYIILKLHTSAVGGARTHSACMTCACALVLAPPLVCVNMLPMRRCRLW